MLTSTLSAVATVMLLWGGPSDGLGGRRFVPKTVASGPGQCFPDATGMGCAGQCGTPDEFCTPTEIRGDLHGNFMGVTCCSCEPPQCHVDFNPATLQIFCANDCPTGLPCQLLAKGNTDGTITYSCECPDPAVPDDCDVEVVCGGPCMGPACVERCSGPCPDPNQACVPVEITDDGTGVLHITDCSCDIPENVCRPIVDINVVVCGPSCPDGTFCPPPIATPNGDGSISYTCPPCGPVQDECDTDPSATRCIGQCADPNEICQPVEILADSTGNFLEVTCCDCQAPQCHVDVDPVNLQIFCNDGCPIPGVDCRLVGKGNVDGTITYVCECTDPTIPAECDFGSECIGPCQPGQCVQRCKGPCPDPAQACLPEVILETPAGSGNFVVEVCDCGEPDPNECRPVISQGQVMCIEQCASGLPCPHAVPMPSPDGTGTIWTCPPCDGKPTGACCVDGPGGTTCIEPVTAQHCHDKGGTWQGPFTTCTPDPCDEPEGACCLYESCEDPTCVVTTESDCVDQGGVYLGDFTTCTPGICDLPTGACCTYGAAGSNCTITTAAECNAIEGIYQGDNEPCTAQTCGEPPQSCGVGECCQRPPDYEDPAYATFTGQVAVATKFAIGAGDPAVLVIDVKNKNTAPLNTHWAAATRYSRPSWIDTNLGTVFGLTLDRIGAIYVAATSCYSFDSVGPGGPGAVYRIHPVTGAIAPFVVTGPGGVGTNQIPNTGPGLGNIAYDCARRQFFVTNHEDGKIYRVNGGGIVMSIFDPFAPDNGLPGFAPLGERLWGIAVHNNRVYFSVWNEDLGSPSAAANEIWSVPLNIAGNFAGAPVLELQLPPMPFSTHSNPVADISFSTRGCMLLAERSMFSDTFPSAHDSRVLEYTFNGFNWVLTGNTFQVGVLGGAVKANSSGGIDYDPDGNVWANGDALQFGPQTIYGTQCLPGSGGSVANSVLIDFDGSLVSQEKTEIGDIELPCIPCVKPPLNMVGWWPLDEMTGPTANEIVVNNDGTHNNGPTPVNAVVVRGLRFDGTNDFVQAADHPLLDFATGDFTFDAWVRTCADTGIQQIIDKRSSNPLRGYAWFLFNGLPSLQIADPGGFGNFLSTVNVADGQWHHLAVTVDRDDPAGGTFYVDGAVTDTINPTARAGNVNNNANLYIGMRDPSFGAVVFDGEIDELEIFNRELTAVEVQSIYAAANAGKCKDTCHVPWDSPFCINVNTIVVNMTICNHSTEPHSYNWSLGPVAAGPGCTVNGPTGFSPPSGSVTVGAGQCVNIPVTITRPPGLTAPNTACFDFFVNNVDTGNFFSCRGSVQAKNKWCLHWISDVPIDIGWGTTANLVFDVTNESDDGGVLNYEVSVMPSDMSPEPSPVSLNGLPPGEPVIDTLALQPGQSGTVEVSAQFASFDAFRFYDVIVSYDEDLDGQVDAAASAGIRSGPPSAEEGCTTTSECADADTNGVRDDSCIWTSCEDGSCNDIPINFADMGGAFGACPPDGFTNLFDRSHALLCFAGTNPCDALNIDAGGAFGVCQPDGFCNLFDVNHALTAFAGTNACSCPGGAAPVSALPPVGVAELTVVPSSRTVRPGQTVDVRVLLDGPLPDLQSYQLHLQASGGSSGKLELVGITVEPDAGDALGALPGFQAVNLATGQMLRGLDAGGVATKPKAYLATFTYRASRDAAGSFVVDVLHDAAAGHGSFLVSDFHRQIEIGGTRPAVVQVK